MRISKTFAGIAGMIVSGMAAFLPFLDDKFWGLLLDIGMSEQAVGIAKLTVFAASAVWATYGRVVAKGPMV